MCDGAVVDNANSRFGPLSALFCVVVVDLSIFRSDTKSAALNHSYTTNALGGTEKLSYSAYDLHHLPAFRCQDGILVLRTLHFIDAAKTAGQNIFRRHSFLVGNFGHSIITTARPRGPNQFLQF